MKKREKILAAAVGALFVLLLGRLTIFSGSGTSGAVDLDATYKTLSADVEKKTALLGQLKRKTERKLTDWNRRSLPADPKIARPLYEKWLVGLVEEVGFSGTKLDPGEPRSRPGVYTTIPLAIRGEGTLDQLVTFLYKFYSVGYLHKIRAIRVKPLEGSRDFEIAMLIEAVSLPGAKHRDSLCSEPSGRLELADLAAYRQALGRRRMEGDRFAESGGFFASYTPPPPPPRPPVVRTERKRPPPEPSFDPSKYAFVTAIIEVAGRSQVWIVVRTEGETLKLFEGEPLHVGSIDGKIARITPRHVEIEVDGQRRVIPLGNNLHDAQEDTANGP